MVTIIGLSSWVLLIPKECKRIKKIVNTISIENTNEFFTENKCKIFHFNFFFISNLSTDQEFSNPTFEIFALYINYLFKQFNFDLISSNF